MKFKKKLPSKRRAKARRLEKAVLSKTAEGKQMWSDAAVLVGVCHPMVKLLRMADGQAPCTGEVYHFMYTLQVRHLPFCCTVPLHGDHMCRGSSS